MTSMEYRAYIRVPSLDVEDDDAERMLVSLERLHGELGPVLSGEGDGFDVILLTDRGDRAEAAVQLYDAVVDALRACGLTDLYPTRVEVEPVDGFVAA